MTKLEFTYHLFRQYQRCYPPRVDPISLAQKILSTQWTLETLTDFLYVELGGKSWGWGDGEAEHLAKQIMEFEGA